MKLYLRPKGENGLPLHPTANVEECMKSYDKVVGDLYTEEDMRLSFEEENKLLREKINKLEDLTTSVTRVEIISKDNGREIVIKSEDIDLSFQDDMRTMKVFYGYGELDKLKQ